MITGEQVINALKNCNDDCSNCVASYKGTSCKEHQKRIDEWAKKKSKQLHEVLNNGVWK